MPRFRWAPDRSVGEGTTPAASFPGCLIGAVGPTRLRRPEGREAASTAGRATRPKGASARSLPRRSKDHEAVAARILTTRECRHTSACLDRELLANVRNSSDHGPVVPRIGKEKDRPPGVQVSLLGSESTLSCLDVVYPCLCLDDGVKRGVRGNRVGAAPITRDGNRHFSPPADRFVQSHGEPPQQCDVRLVANGRRHGMDRHRELVTESGRHSRDDAKVDMGRQASFNPDHLGMGDAGESTEIPRAHACCCSSNSEFSADTPEDL